MAKPKPTQTLPGKPIPMSELGKFSQPPAPMPHETRAHSKIGASSMHRWRPCPGSVREIEKLPPEAFTQSSYALEGTRAHEVAEILLSGKKAPKDASAEMLEAVQVYIDEIKARSKGATEVLIEHKFDLSSLHPGLYGTADCVVYYADKKHLLVMDYKHGSGVLVEPEENEQLLYYGLGALLSLKYPCQTVEIAIAQPRYEHPKGPIRSWMTTPDRLVDFSADLIDAAKRTEDPNAPLVVGDHCRFCPAAGVCPKQKDTALSLAEQQFGAVGQSYDPATLANVLDALPRIEAWAKQVREFAYREACAGRMPPGYKLVDKEGRRHWVDEAATIKALRKAGLKETDYMHKPELKSPAQIEAMIRPVKKAQELTAPLTKKVSSGTTLVHESDYRPAALNSAEKDFAALMD